MTNEIKGGGANELSTDINVITAEINAYQRIAGEAIFEIGKRLKHVKENDLVHGEFGDWLKTVDIDRTLATRLMKVAEEFDGNYATWHKIPLRSLYEIATLPPEQREQPHKIPSTGATKTVDDMTVKELREVKKSLRDAEDMRTQAESRVKQAERSEEIAKRRLEEFEGREPTIEIRTEYVEVVKMDETLEHRIKEYEERFGAIENYAERPRATNLAEVTTSVMTFSKAVRDLAKRHAYLIQYQDTISALDPTTKREYNEAVTALTDLARDFCKVSETPTIIDAKFTEQ